jgi:predicted DNA-binding transcriptional regulator YafY
MATNKHASIRYLALDRCFNNFGRKYFIEDLIEACNIAIYNFTGIEDGVKRRQIFDDISFMESEQGWSIQLDRHKEGKKVYYRYSDVNFSIKNNGINQNEAEQLKASLEIMSRFKGLPQFEWIEEIQARLEDTFKLNGTNKNSVIGFEHNPYLKGLDYFSSLFNAINNKLVLKINYKSFNQEIAGESLLHPWYLKQYNNRWFLFGYNEKYNAISNFALDRIIDFEETNEKYVENTEVNFEEYFDDVVGVTVKGNESTEKVLVKISKNLWPYIESKPLHGSQKIKAKSENEITIELNVEINHELISLLFSYIDSIEIIEPEILKVKFKLLSENIFKKYN